MSNENKGNSKVLKYVGLTGLLLVVLGLAVNYLF